MNPLAGILNEAWRMYRAHARHLIVIALVIYIAAAILVAVLTLFGFIGELLGTILELMAGFLVQAALVKAVQDVRDGRADLSPGDTVSAALPTIWPVAGASILAAIAIAIGFILIIVPGLILITIWALIVPVIVIERTGALASFRRSQSIVRGHGWHVFGTLVLVWIVEIVANLLLGVILSFLPTALSSSLSAVISGALIAPYIAIVVTMIYYRLTGQDPESTGVPGGYAG